MYGLDRQLHLFKVNQKRVHLHQLHCSKSHLTVLKESKNTIIMSSSQPTEASSMEPNTQPLAIADAPATDKQAGDVKTIDVGDGQSIKLDALGPIIVNSDGVSFSSSFFRPLSCVLASSRSCFRVIWFPYHLSFGIFSGAQLTFSSDYLYLFPSRAKLVNRLLAESRIGTRCPKSKKSGLSGWS